MTLNIILGSLCIVCHVLSRSEFYGNDIKLKYVILYLTSLVNRPRRQKIKENSNKTVLADIVIYSRTLTI
jgi:hypothetical protein